MGIMATIVFFRYKYKSKFDESIDEKPTLQQVSTAGDKQVHMI
jgi:hypothetical protein